MTHRIEPPFWRRLKESNPFFWTQLKKLNLLKKYKKWLLKNSKIKPFSEKIWLKELNPLFSMSEWIEPIWWMTHRIVFFFFEIRIRLTELNLFLWYDSIFFKKSQIIEFFSITQRIEPLFMNLFSIWLKEMKSFFILTHRIETLCFSQNISKNWTSLSYELLFYTTQIIEFFQYAAKIFQIDSKSRTHFFFMTQRNDAQNWTLFLWIGRKELNPLFKVTQRIEPFV